MSDMAMAPMPQGDMTKFGEFESPATDSPQIEAPHLAPIILIVDAFIAFIVLSVLDIPIMWCCQRAGY